MSYSCRTADFLSGSNRVKICWHISLPHTSRFSVVTNLVQAWDQVDLRHVGKDTCSRDSHDNSSLVEVCARPDKLSSSTARQLTRPDKTFCDLALSDIAQQALILSQTCLNSPHTSRQVKIFCQLTKNWLVCSGLQASLTPQFIALYNFTWTGLKTDPIENDQFQSLSSSVYCVENIFFSTSNKEGSNNNYFQQRLILALSVAAFLDSVGYLLVSVMFKP